MNLLNKIKNIFLYQNKENYNFKISNNPNNLSEKEIKIDKNENITISNSLEKNLEYLKFKYNMIINKDIQYKEFFININNKKIPAMIYFIDGLADQTNINEYILKPLLYNKYQNIKTSSIKFNTLKKQKKIIRKINLENYIKNLLIPETTINKEESISNVIEKINNGFTALFIENLKFAFIIDTKKQLGRSVDEPKTEFISNASHEGLVENIKTNTALVRKIINNENFISETLYVGKLSKTQVNILYINTLTNESLVNEVKHRISNLDIDYLISSGTLEQFIKDNKNSTFPEAISTERPDTIANYLLIGKVAILVNGSPFALIVPSCFIDFLTSTEDFNNNYHFSNFVKSLRFAACLFAILTPGLYIAITMYHYELIPSELLYAIISAREAIPFPIIFEIIIMEICYELIQEASIRVSSYFSTTIGIIGALVLGDAAVSANIVSPILIIVIAFSGICTFSIPDNHLRYSIKIYRFIYIFLGYLGGFIGIASGLFINIVILSSQSSFGIEFFSPYFEENMLNNSRLLYKPVWQREKRNNNLNTKNPNMEAKISMKWREND